MSQEFPNENVISLVFFIFLRWILFFFSYWQCLKNALSLNRQVCLFLKRGANQHATDEEGKDPLTIAVEAANADIVTL